MHNISHMNTQSINLYNSPHQFEPLFPQERLMGGLLEKSSDLTRAATALGASAATTAQVELRSLLRTMNSYYTNRMEGEHTRPRDIERALQKDFSDNVDLARRQRLAIAHIKTEIQCEKEVSARVLAGDDVGKWLYSQDAIQWIHLQLFDSLSIEDRTLADGSVLVPGQLRTREVSVGNHIAPTAASLSLFLNRWGQVYGGSRRGEASIVALSAAHQRLAWVHPFLDGNGRVTRLHTHLALHAQGLTNGLWSPLRGYARSESRYKALIMGADDARRGALDGRGNLTESGLIDWMNYTLDTCIDQVKFMTAQLNINTMQDRIGAALMFEESLGSGVRKEALRPLHYLFSTQFELGRADFKTMTGLGDRVSTQALSSLLKNGYLSSDSPYGKVRFSIPRHAMRFYFPALWPEAEQDEAMGMDESDVNVNWDRPKG